MPSLIATIEDALIAEIKRLLGNRVRTVDWAPPDWDEDFITRALKNPPGVLVVFLGGRRLPGSSENFVTLETNWSIAAVTRHAHEAKARARGDAREIGCYDILELLAPALEVFEIPNVGAMELDSWGNELALKLESQSLMMQSLNYSRTLEIPRVVNLDALHDFETFTGDLDVGQQDDAPTCQVVVNFEEPTLPIVYPSFLANLQPPAEPSDLIDVDAKTNKGNTVTMNADGTYSIENDDGHLPRQHFTVRLYDQSEGAWHAQSPMTIYVGQ